MRAAGWEVADGRLAETHEYFHRQLDDTTAFGGLTSTVAALADSSLDERWVELRDRLLTMVDLVHEAFAVGMSLLTTQRSVEPIPNYPTYDRHVMAIQRLVGEGTHPWVALAALRAAATACMQSEALNIAVSVGIEQFDPRRVPALERPNHRLAALLAGGYADEVANAHSEATLTFGDEAWWRPAAGVSLSLESMDGAAADASAALHRQLLARAQVLLVHRGGGFVEPGHHHEDLRRLLGEARALAPAGLARIGALVEAPGGELLHGGPLDGQTIELTAAPARASVLPSGALSGASGEGEQRHLFVVVTTPRRLRAAYQLEGQELSDGEAIACVRSTVFDGERRDSVLLLPVASPEDLTETEVGFVSVFSSAIAADPGVATRWMQWAHPARVSLVMDTPATAALRRWCAGGATFRTETRVVAVSSGDELRIIAGRVEEPGHRSPLVIIPSTEFGARWFEAARMEDDVLSRAVVEDPTLFETESAHLDIVLGHLLLEERFVGTGSWRR